MGLLGLIRQRSALSKIVIVGLAMALCLLAWALHFEPLVPARDGPPSMGWPSILLLLISGGSLGSILSIIARRWRVHGSGRADQLERLEYAVLAAKVGIWEWDVRKDRITWNDRMLELYGLRREQFGGNVQAWKDGLHPEDFDRATQAIEAALRGETEFNTDFRVVWPDGTIRHLHASAFIKRDSRGSPIVMYGLNRDITDEVRTLASLYEVNSYFQAAMDQSPVGIVIADAPSGNIRFANNAAVALRGGTRQQLVEGVSLGGYDTWQLVSLDGRPLETDQMPLVRSMTKGEQVSEEIGILNSEGKIRVILTNTAPIRREDGSIRAGIAVFFDNTERHQLLEQVQLAREAAERASGAKSRFLDIAAHELRTPVTAFSLLIQVTQKRLADGHPVDADVLTRLRAQVDRLSRLVVDLLEVSRLDRGMLILKQEPKDLGRILSDCIFNFQIQYPERIFSLAGNGTQHDAMIDPVRIYEVISNLLDNAIRYSPSNTPIEVTIEERDHWFRVSVRDHGAGITSERKKSLFQPFERGIDANESAHSGLGLGLYICKKIIEMHGGSIGVESTPGIGSTFFFEIRRHSQNQAAS